MCNGKSDSNCKEKLFIYFRLPSPNVSWSHPPPCNPIHGKDGWVDIFLGNTLTSAPSEFDACNTCKITGVFNVSTPFSSNDAVTDVQVSIKSNRR